MLATRSLVFLTTLAVLVSCCARVPAAPSVETPRLSHASPSIAALADSLLNALAANDERALHQLRVSESEYRTVIEPATVEPGQPPRHIDEASSKLFWSMLDTKSRDFARPLLSEFGGKTLTRKDVRFIRGVHQYAGYTAHSQMRVLVADEHGKETLVRSGTVAQVGDQYKLIGLNWDD